MAEHHSLRHQAGALLLDVPRYLPRLVRPRAWTAIGNRRDRLEQAPDGVGVRCGGRWVSDLHACSVFPAVGGWIMRRAFAEWPVRFVDDVDRAKNPDLSFVVPFRGLDRLPQLRATVESILGQQDVRIECLVVEQGPRREAPDALPRAARYLHLPNPENDARWRKSWAFNVGVAEALGQIVVCHDADILVPSGYAREILRRIQGEGFEAVHLQRFLFRLGEQDTARLIAGRALEGTCPEEVWQNWQGGTLAIRKAALVRIGGYDERFVDWGGEDNELYDRCSVLKRYDYGYLPFVHLWHRPQEAKATEARDRALAFMAERLAMPPAQRVADLTGAVAKPAVRAARD